VSDAGESRLCEEGLVFFGRVMAGQCHELVNVFNIVNELAGLQEDTLDRVRRGDPGSLEKLGELVGRIQAQVKRGQTIIRNMHQFAHSVDAPWVVFDAREVIGRVVFFATRQTRLREAELLASLPDAGVALESNPFWLQQAVYMAIELLLGGSTERGRIAVTLSSKPDGAAIVLVGADPVPRGTETAARLAALSSILGVLGGEVREAPRHAADDRLVLFVPHSRRGSARPESSGASQAAAGGDC
jgi:hypothetical protein